jgi:hypothetical protein
MKKYFKVKNWDDFQHYKDRNPPWIKLHNHLLDDYDFECLGDAAKGHLLCIWMLASRTKNSMPFDVNWISKKIGSSSKVNLKALIESGFLVMEHDASTLLQGSEQDATGSVPSVEESRGEERREEQSREDPRPIGLNCEAWDLWISFRAKCKFKKYKTESAMTKLITMGDTNTQALIIQQSIDNEYQGLFPVKQSAAQQQPDNWDDDNWHKDLGM